MRALSLHSDVIVLISSIWQTTATAVRSDEEGFLIDSPVLPEELSALPDVLEQAGFPASGLLATHADWDHLLGRLAFPDAPLGLAQSSAERLAAEPAAPGDGLRRFDQEHYIERPAPLSLGETQAMPVPGRLELGTDRELELHLTAGHTGDGMAIAIPWAGVLVVGDYLSPVEIPMLSPGGSLEAYVQTLERLRPLVRAAETVIPGHGAPLPSERAATILEEDLSYLRDLPRVRDDTPLPEGRRSATQKTIHGDNLARVGEAAG